MTLSTDNAKGHSGDLARVQRRRAPFQHRRGYDGNQEVFVELDLAQTRPASRTIAQPGVEIGLSEINHCRIHLGHDFQPRVGCMETCQPRQHANALFNAVGARVGKLPLPPTG